MFNELEGLGEYLGEFAAAAPSVQASRAGLLSVNIKPLQVMLNRLGERVAEDGSYGPATKAAWQRQARRLQQDGVFDRASSSSVWILPATNTAITQAFIAVGAVAATAPAPRAPAPTARRAAAPTAARRAAAPTAARRAAAPTAARPVAAAPLPSGAVIKSVAELQKLLFGVGWTAKKLKQDGLYGTQTKTAWGISAKLRGLPQVFERVDGKTAQVSDATYTKILADQAAPATVAAAAAAVRAPTAGPSAPVPATPVVATPQTASATRPVLEIQKLLQAIGWRARSVPVNGKFDANVAKAWAESTKRRGLNPSIVRIDARTAKVSAAAFDAISAEVTGKKPEVPPKPTVPVSALPPLVQKILSIATFSVPTEIVQQGLSAGANTEGVAVTGVWDANTTQGYIRVAGRAWTPQTVEAWKAALPLLLTPDGKSVKLEDAIGKALRTAAGVWLARQQQTPPTTAPIPAAAQQAIDGQDPRTWGPAQGPTQGPSPGPSPYQGPAPSAAQGPAPSADQGQGPSADQTPAPSADPGTPGVTPPAPSDLWGGLVKALTSMSQRAASFDSAIDAARATGGTIRPEIRSAYTQWIASGDVLKNRVADMIEKSPELRSAIEAAGQGVGLSGWHATTELEAYLGELEAVAEKVLELLREPLSVPAGLQGFAQVPPPVVAGAVGAAAALGRAAWVKIIQLLSVPAVTATATTLAAGSVIRDAVNGETEAYLSHEDNLAKLLADGAITVEEYNALKKNPPEQKSIMVPIVLGIVALGGFALYLKNRSA